MDNPLILRDFTDDCDTGLGGLEVGKEIDRRILLYPKEVVTISLYGITNISPSLNRI